MSVKLVTGSKSYNDIAMERIMSKVIKPNGDDGCWVWTGARNSQGRAHVNFKGRMASTARVVFMLVNNVVLAPKEYVCHSCDNILCVNPNHLKKGDARSNNLEAIARNRRPGLFKMLSKFEVRLIEVQLKTKKIQEVAKMFGSSFKTVGRVSQGIHHHQGNTKKKVLKNAS